MLAVTPDTLHERPDESALQAGLPSVRAQAMRRFALTLPSYALALLVLYVGASLGLFPAARAHLISLVVGVGLSIFCGLIQSGRTMRWRDPLLVLPQVLFSVTVVALAYHLIEISRGIAFMWLAVIVVYDMRRLPFKQVRLVIIVATILQLANFISIWAGGPSEPVLIDEVLSLVGLALLLPTLAMVSSQARAWVKQRKQQNIRREQTLQTLSFLSAHDTLTGLYNRRHMLEGLEREARKTARFGSPFTVAMLDVDFFKRVNDQHGHAVGDAVLKRFSDIASSIFGPLETVARWGGEEFVVLMPEACGAHAYRRLQELRTAVHQHDWGTVHPGLLVTFSAGLAEYRHGPVQQLMEKADRALYEAKRAGRDRVHPEFANATPHPSSDDPQGGLEVKADASLKQAAVPMACVAGSAAIQSAGMRVLPPRSVGQSPDASSWTNRLQRLLFTNDPTTRTLLKLASAVSVTYLLWLLVVIIYAMPRHLFPHWLELVLMSHLTLGALAPLVIIRSGWSKRFKDPIFLMEQCIWANAMLVAAQVFSPFGRGALLGVLCQVQVFGFPSFSPRQALGSGSAVLVMLVSSWVGMSVWGGPGFDAAEEGLRVVAACGVLVLLTLQSYNYARSRQKTSKERRELEQSINEVQRLSTTDPLTGLYNRQHLHEVLDREAMRSSHGSPGFCVALIDLDHFKRINDTHGHQVGDQVLVGFASLSKTFFRDTDTLGRWGGEEFLVIMPGGSQAPIDRLRLAVASARLSEEAAALQVTFSAGVAHHRIGEAWADTLERADRSLYAAKEAGRNQCKGEVNPDAFCMTGR